MIRDLMNFAGRVSVSMDAALHVDDLQLVGHVLVERSEEPGGLLQLALADLADRRRSAGPFWSKTAYSLLISISLAFWFTTSTGLA